jgi:tetratricopeptide (TPR) repeat protein
MTRPTPTSSGQLARTPFPHLLVYAHDRQLTGTFEFRAPDASMATVLMLQGRPAKAKLSAQSIHLGQVLLELGVIDAAMHDASLREMASAASGARRLHGAILLERGAIDRGQLDDGLRAQLLRKMAHVATMPVATVFEFYGDWDGLADFGAEPSPIDTFAVVWGAIREQPPFEHAKAALERMTRGRLRVTKTAQLDRFVFTQEERRWIDLLRVRALRLDDLFAAAEGINERITRLMVYCLAITKQIEIVSEEEAAAAEAAAAAQIPPASSSAPITPKGAVGRITLRRERVITNPNIVKEESSPRVPSIPDQRASPPPDQASTAIAATPVPTDARRKDILERARVIDKQNYFEMLGVTPESPPEDVKNAYITLAKTWHPDRLPTVLAEVKDQCARVFARMSEAHQTLTDGEKRKRYLTLMKEGGETPEQQEEIQNVVGASVEFQKAEICMRKNDLAQAESLARHAVEMDPNQADYIALLAWVESLKDVSADGTQARIADLDRAIKINERCERAYFYRAMLYKRHNRDGPAFKDFKKVAELNPKNIDAQRELRLYEMRGAPKTQSQAPAQAPVAGKPGLFQKFFKK